MRNLLFAILAALALESADAQDVQLGDVSVGMTGENWLELNNPVWGPDGTKLGKLATLRGIYDGLFFGQSTQYSTLPQSVGWDTVIDGLDQFYVDATNRHVVIVWALQVIRLKLDGRSEQDVQLAIRRARCRAAALRGAGAIDEQMRRYRDCDSAP